MTKFLQTFLLAVFLAVAAPAQSATAYVNTTVQGALAPGVYGRVDIGNAPPPVLVYPQPVIIQRAPERARQPPLYLHVPPGHVKKWSKHCARYNACGQPVYFVRVRGDDDFERRGGRSGAYRDDEGRRGDRFENDEGGGKHGKGHGKGKGKGHGKGHDKG